MVVHQFHFCLGVYAFLGFTLPSNTAILLSTGVFVSFSVQQTIWYLSADRFISNSLISLTPNACRWNVLVCGFSVYIPESWTRNHNILYRKVLYFVNWTVNNIWNWFIWFYNKWFEFCFTFVISDLFVLPLAATFPHLFE